MTPLAFTIGNEEVALLLAGAGAVMAGLKVFDHWSRTRSAAVAGKVAEAAAEAKEEQREYHRFERIEEQLAQRKADAEKYIPEFIAIKQIVADTAANVARISKMQEQSLEESRGVHQSLRELLAAVLKNGITRKAPQRR